ncbi:hypothetical protein LTR92_006941 [Exophiala xenobiotica]|nr:hypothetical protein LTR92_006941 [Exophiala xenobiotica]
MAPALPPRAPSPLAMGTNWREGMSRLIHPMRDRNPTEQEVSRWSKTTTESEASETVGQLPSKKVNVLKKKMKQHRLSKDTTNSSPVDPSYDPVTKKFLTAGDMEMPPIAVTGPDEPRSFYDSGSDDSSEASPVIQRASSVRVARPHIVQHNNNSGGSVPKLYAPHSTPTDGESSTLKISQVSSDVSGLTEPDQDADKPVGPGGPAEALKALEGAGLGNDTGTALPQIPAEQNDTMKETLIEYPNTPGRISALSTLPTPLGGFGSVRMPRTATGTTNSSVTYVSPPSIDGLRSNPPTEMEKQLSRAISAPVRNSRRVTIRPADLVINRGNNNHQLFRENIVSTPYPARHSSIGEIDEVMSLPNKKANKEKNTKPVKSSKSLRHTARLLSTRKKSTSEQNEKPAPSTLNSTSTPPNGHDALDEKDPATTQTTKEGHVQQPPEVPLSTKPVVPPPTAKSDRFPSPVAPEILFLDLRLARHPSARVTVEVEVTNKTSFDDEQLFTIIRRAYNENLLGMTRQLFCARSLSYASLTDSDFASSSPATAAARLGTNWQQHGNTNALSASSSSGSGCFEIDGADFIRHLLHPRSGRRRKMWLLWLRNNQSTESPATRRSRMAMSRAMAMAAATANNNESSPDSQTSPVFSFVHSRNNSGGGELDHQLLSNPLTAPLTSVSLPAAFDSGIGSIRAPGGATSHQPSIRIPRMPFQPLSYRSALSSRRGAAGSAGSSGPPTLYLHYTFSLRKIVGMLVLVLFMAIFTSLMWILFGLPGRGADQGNGTTVVEGRPYTLSWKRDAQSRVGVGLVMGIVVLLLGLVGEAVWVWGSWVLI